MTDSSPVQVPGTVLTTRRIGAYQTMTLVAPGVAERFRPGQFVALAVGGEQSSMLLRRCFAVREVKPDFGGTVEIVFSVRGKGTQWLAGLRPRDIVDVAGPLGRPFPLPRHPVTCVLVGVAHASAALFPLAAVLRQRDCPLHFLLGGGTADDVHGARGARRAGDSVAVATGDGSLGSAGTVEDLLAGAIEGAQAEVVYACGPLDTLRSVSRTCAGYGIPAQVAVEEPMACGTGVCMACVLPVIGDDGATHMVRTCVEGPVFRGERVRWDDVGTIPFDALGAPRALRLGERP
ncbi:dihydroorotate dehydrogenase electron transfer subunit [Actinoallomurus sp. NBC_01490]|uniref:dihydroorotate dehydrogenase electron transfer subunit n=1 Tax=Actinoallomurus sp. NBC_01490 TaxID=2903557 RepID=UPI002E336395|nr:dihydroorotate dehydrogenase electron transfer subunit [Actinoallomurus sp. NBC_01490]